MKFLKCLQDFSGLASQEKRIILWLKGEDGEPFSLGHDQETIREPLRISVEKLGRGGQETKQEFLFLAERCELLAAVRTAIGKRARRAVSTRTRQSEVLDAMRRKARRK